MAVSAAAQRRAATPSGTLAGVVFGPDGQPAAGASVILQASDGRHPKAVRTNDQGRFWFPMLRPGPYEVRAQAKRLSSEWKHNQPVRPGQQTSVTLHLAQNKPTASKSRARSTKPAANPVKSEPH